MVPVTVDNSTNGNILTITLSWREPFNNLDPIVSYTVSCSGDDTCPLNFTTTDITTRSYTITNLTPNAHYIFSVVATNSIGSGEAGVVYVVIVTPPSTTVTTTATTIASRVDTTTITSTESVTVSMPSQSKNTTTSLIESSYTPTISSTSINTTTYITLTIIMFMTDPVKTYHVCVFTQIAIKS